MLTYVDQASAAYAIEAPQRARGSLRRGARLTVEEAYRELQVRGLLGSVGVLPGTATNTNYRPILPGQGQPSESKLLVLESNATTDFTCIGQMSAPMGVRYSQNLVRSQVANRGTPALGCPTRPTAPRVMDDGECASPSGSLRYASAGPTPLLQFLRALPDSWDGDDAPAPAPSAIDRAESLLRDSTMNGVQVAEVDADVLGGVAIWLAGPSPAASAWISLMNNGTDTLVLCENGKVTHHPWNQHGGGSKILQAFLRGTGEATRD